MKQKPLSVIGVTDNMQGSIYFVKESQTLRERRTESHGSLKQFFKAIRGDPNQTLKTAELPQVVASRHQW